MTWNGATWSNGLVLESAASIATRECIAVEYSQTLGKAMFSWGSGTFFYSRTWNGTGWEPKIAWINLAATCNWFSMKTDPNSDGLVLVSVDSSSQLNTVRWNGTSWILDPMQDNSVWNPVLEDVQMPNLRRAPGHQGHIVSGMGRSEHKSNNIQDFQRDNMEHWHSGSYLGFSNNRPIVALF